MDCGIKITYLLLPIFPLLSVSVDYRRAYFYVSIILFVILSNWITKHSRFMISSLMIIVSTIFLYRFVLLGNYETVYYPIFSNNLLIKYLSSLII